MHHKNVTFFCLGSLVALEPEITVRHPAALEASTATVQGAALEAMEGTAALEVNLVAPWLFCSVLLLILILMSLLSLQVALVETSTATMATEETTATPVVWIGGGTSQHRNRLSCQPNGNHMLT